MLLIRTIQNKLETCFNSNVINQYYSESLRVILRIQLFLYKKGLYRARVVIKELEGVEMDGGG